MRIPFTKMQGAGNDFVVLDETVRRLDLTTAQYRWLADRHFGVGADQILSVRPAPDAAVDFAYAIHNADGGEVEHCGNGARCFARFVRERGLTDKASIRVRVANGDIELHLRPDGRVTVDMGAPVFDLARIPFDPAQAGPAGSKPVGSMQKWPITLTDSEGTATVCVAVLSLGNPHAVLFVAGDIEHAPVARLGPLVERHPAFARGVNAGFAQVTGRSRLSLRVWERGAGETLACGTGACAAVVAGIRLGLLDAAVRVQMRGGELGIEWDGGASPVRMTGPAVTVFEGSVELPPSG